MMTEQLSGKITVAPQVLITIVEQTALKTPGVRALGPRPPRPRHSEGHRASGAGAEATIVDNTVSVAVGVKASPAANMLHLAETLQHDIARSIEHMLGMKVAQVDVYIDDVIFSEQTQD